METKYDALVTGTGISGLVSAALLARRGLKIAVIGTNSHCEQYEKERYLFTRSPFIATGIHDGPIKAVADEIGLPGIAASKAAVAYQTVLPDERVDVYGDNERFYEELRRCFPDEIDRILTFYDHLSAMRSHVGQVIDMNPFSFRPLLPFGVIRGKRDIISLMRGMGLSERFQSFIGAQLSSFSHLYGPISAISAADLLESARKGVIGGSINLKGLLLQKLKTLGGEIVRSDAKEISKNGNRWLVRTEEEAISGRAVVGNMEAAVFCGLFLDVGKRYLRKSEKIKRSHLAVTVNLGVKDSGIPVGMADNVIFLREYGKEASCENLLQISMSPSAKGKRSVVVNCRLPAERSGKNNVRDAAESVLEGVERLCPFIDRHVEILEIADTLPAENGLFATTLGRKMGVGVLPHQIIKGEVFFTGPEVFPGLGFNGLVYSGDLAARGVAKALLPDK